MEVLGKQTNQPLEEVEGIATDFDGWVTLICHEFTSFCPVTNQPDFGQLTIRYRPNKLLVETKSLKLFLWSFRQVRSFNEALIKEIGWRIFQKIQPKSLNIAGKFHPRGGIELQCEISFPN